jgi:hypothetical protein
MLHLAPLAFALSATSAAPAAAAVMTDAAAAAHAQAARTPRVPETRVLGGVGVAGGKTHGGLGFSALATHRISAIQLGIELNTSFLFSAMAGVGAVGGLHFGDNLSASVLGTVGAHHYSGVGRGLLSDDPGVRGSTPYLGGRLVIGYAFRVSNPTRRPFIGVLAGVDHDLDQRNLSVRYSDKGWFSGETSEQTSTHHLGQTSYTALFVGGIELDLAPY